MTIANNKKTLADVTVVLQIHNATGGAILAARDLREVQLMFSGNIKKGPPLKSSTIWIAVGVSCAVGLIIIIAVVVWFIVKKRKRYVFVFSLRTCLLR